ncbi:MAG: hypothetical protein WEG56_07550 [Chloroflexota bacterium]
MTQGPADVVAAPVPLATTRGLLPAAFDLLVHSGPSMRRASFYIGAIVLGTVGPLVVGMWAVAVIGMDRPIPEMDAILESSGGGMVALLVAIATLGMVVAAVESRTLAAAVLGGVLTGRPVSTRQALARSRRTFWRAVVASVLVAVPLTVAQSGFDLVVGPLLGGAEEATLLTSTLLTAVVGAPFAYMLTGVVLGDVDPFESLRRSFRMFAVRRSAAFVIVLFETVAALLILLGIGAGLDVALRVFDALGLGPDAGPLGVAITTAGVVAVIFAFGTLLFTVMAVTIAPQVVMFLGLTHATFGLERVLPGGPDDPDRRAPDGGRFRWFTRPMLVGFVVGAIGLLGLASAYG